MPSNFSSKNKRTNKQVKHIYNYNGQRSIHNDDPFVGIFNMGVII
jgi:hypothetical protein